jgi:hypothetical protein
MTLCACTERSPETGQWVSTRHLQIYSLQRIPFQNFGD